MSIWVHILLLLFVLYKAYKFTRKVTFAGKTIWITGGSSGIGEALALELVRLGAKVIISGRNLAELDRVKSSAGPLSSSIEIFQQDLSNADSAIPHTKTFLGSRKIDILINNAGIGQRCGFLDDLDSLKMERRLMELNYFSVIGLTKAVYDSLNDRGQVVIISSMAGVLGSPYRSSYSGSKFAVSQFFDTLISEDPKFDVTLIYPGYIRTSFSKNALDAEGKPFGKTGAGTLKGMAPESFAKLAASAIYQRKKHVFICALHEKIACFLKYILPDTLDDLTYNFGKKVKQEMETTT